MTHSQFGSFSSPEAFVSSVLDLEPIVAAFDCDGTLWPADSGMKFFYWEIEQGLIAYEVAQPVLRRYDEYLAGRVSEDDMCGEMVTMHRGLREATIREYAGRFVREHVIPEIFPEMGRLVESLISRKCEVWAVSSTNNWVIEEAVRALGIPGTRVLAIRVRIDNGMATGDLGEITSGPGKATALKRVLSRSLDASFGNSIFDLEMLELASHPFPVNPNADLKEIAVSRGWSYYQPSLRATSSTNS